MAWIESHTNLIKHYKVLRMATILEIKPVHIIGHLHCFWHNVLELREDGDITVWTPKEVAFYSCYEGDPKCFYNALKDGWIDERNGFILVHDWLDYAGRYLQAKYRSGDPGRLKIIINKHSQTAQSDCTVSPPNLTNLTNLTLPNQIHCATSFEEIWDKYPNKVGRKQAERHFKATVKTDVDYQNIQKAVEVYLKSDRVKRGYIQNGSTWFNNWQDWIEYTEAKDGNTSQGNSGTGDGKDTSKGSKYGHLSKRIG